MTSPRLLLNDRDPFRLALLCTIQARRRPSIAKMQGIPETIVPSDPDELANGDIRPKRRRFSAPLCGRTTLDRHKEGSRRSTSLISDEVDGTLRFSVNSKPAITSRYSSPVSDSALLTEPQLATQVIDDNQQWEVHKIIGGEDVDGVLHYRVKWASTLEPEHSLGHAKELMDEFEARLQAKRGVKNGRGRPVSKRVERVVVEANVSGS
jgi:hypothetical protein